MHDVELGWIEQRLRKAASGQRPPAPDRLVDYIATVPTRVRPAGRIELAFDEPRVRRSVFAVAAAAAVVVAVVGGAALMSLRQGPVAATQPAAVSDGWQWQSTDGTLYFAEMAVSRGFVATCGHSSGNAMVGESVCSSSDGLHWSVPADPAIVSVEGGGTFLPNNILVRKGTYMAVSRQGSGTSTGPALTLWRSTDGVRWRTVELPASLGLTTIDLVQLVPDGFLGVGTKPSYPQEMVISADGLTWSKASDMPYGSAVAGASYYWSPTIAAGLFVGGPRPGGTDLGDWRTTDGRTWEDVTLPAGFNELSMVVALPDGSLRGVASTYDGSKPNAIVTSVDGLAWQLDPVAPAGSVDVLAVVGDRMVASVGAAANTEPHEVWHSDDWGKSWRQLLDLSGKPVVGAIGTIGGRLEVKGADLATHWLLTPVGANPVASPIESATVPVSAPPSAPETPSVTAAPTPTVSANRTPLPASLTGEWTWRQTDGTHFADAFAVPGGFVATCGHIADNELADASLCSSPDGLKWTVPADPALIVVPANGPFWPIHVTERNGVYLAFALSRPLPTVAEPTASLWRSTDGRHWSQVDSPAFAGQSLVSTGLLADRFAAIVKSADGTAAAVWLSTDGSTWSKAGDLPTVPTRSGFYSQGLYVEGNEATMSQTGTWLTRDGRQWTQVTLPAGATNILSSIQMPDGGFVGLGADFVSGGSGTLMHSSDGLVWKADSTAPSGQLFGLSQVGDRLVLTISQPNNGGPYSVWQSSDRGQTWQPLPGPDGYQLTTMAGRLGDNLSSVTGSDAVVVSVGTLNSR